MRRLLFAFLAVLAAVACTPRGGPPIAVRSDTAEEREAKLAAGQRIAETQCLRCHAVTATALSRNPEAPPLRELAERYPATLLADAFPQRMRVGHPAMPEFPFGDEDIDALLEYLLSIQERQGA